MRPNFEFTHSLSQKQFDACVQAAAVQAIEYSIKHGDITLADRLLGQLNGPYGGPRKKQALIDFLEKWGNLAYAWDSHKFVHRRKTPAVQWTDDYRSNVTASEWTDHIVRSERKTSPYLDVDEELQRLLRKARAFTEDPGRVVFHVDLLRRLEGLSSEYRIREGLEYEREAEKRTLFDESVKRQTMRATKLAKQRSDARKP